MRDKPIIAVSIGVREPVEVYGIVNYNNLWDNPHMIAVHAGHYTVTIVVNENNAQDALDAFVDSEYGHMIVLGDDDLEGRSEDEITYAGNEGKPVDPNGFTIVTCGQPYIKFHSGFNRRITSRNTVVVFYDGEMEVPLKGFGAARELTNDIAETCGYVANWNNERQYITMHGSGLIMRAYYVNDQLHDLIRVKPHYTLGMFLNGVQIAQTSFWEENQKYTVINGHLLGHHLIENPTLRLDYDFGGKETVYIYTCEQVPGWRAEIQRDLIEKTEKEWSELNG